MWWSLTSPRFLTWNGMHFFSPNISLWVSTFILLSLVYVSITYLRYRRATYASFFLCSSWFWLIFYFLFFHIPNLYYCINNFLRWTSDCHQIANDSTLILFFIYITSPWLRWSRHNQINGLENIMSQCQIIFKKLGLLFKLTEFSLRSSRENYS